MEQEQNKQRSSEYKKQWIYFSAGLVAGFILSFSIYFVDKYVFHEKIHFSRTVEHLYEPLRHDEANEGMSNRKAFKESELEQEETKEILSDDSLALESEEVEDYADASDDESEFEILEQGDDNMEVYSEKVVAERKIKVIHADTVSQKIYEHFDVEQWSSPIRNRHSYSLQKQHLKITGMDIAQIKIYYANQHYYLQYHNTFYLLQENHDFEKMIESSPKMEDED